LDPLLKINDAHKSGILPDKIYSLVVDRFKIILEGISRIERASGINFPLAYIEPSVVISQPSGSFDCGIFFARTLPVIVNEKVEIIIQIAAPLVAYGLKGTMHAILAHEFLHYLELMKRMSKMEIVSDEISGNLFENMYADTTRLFEPRAVFDDKTLLLHITKKFPEGFRDYKLEDKVLKNWIQKKMPTINVALDRNTVKIPADVLAKTQVDPILVQKLVLIEQRASKLRKRKLY
jgi:hypothetical protein